MRPLLFTLLLILFLAPRSVANEVPAPAAYCTGDYADDLSELAPRARELERQSYSFCVRNTATYECVAYDSDGNLRRTRKKAIAHGTAFGFRQAAGETLLLTNQHVAEWPAVTDEAHPVDGVPPGCKRAAEALRVVDNESDDYEPDDIPLARVVSDPQLDAAVLRARAALPILPWKIGRSAALRERNAVEVHGFPLGAFRAINVGKVISAFDHDDYKDWDHDDFVIDALLSSGNSGSPVLALSCKTGEPELVGVFHAAYSQGSALNVAIGIEQLRDLMTTLKRSPHPHSEALVTLDEGARGRLQTATRAAVEPFFPLGGLTATARSRSDGAFVFEVFSREFPSDAQPAVVFEDLPRAGAFGEPGRVWFGSPRGLRLRTPVELDGEEQAQTVRLLDALRRDAVAFVDARTSAGAARSREEFERLDRQQRSLRRTVEGRRDLAALALELADRLGPHGADRAATLAEVFVEPARAPQVVATATHAAAAARSPAAPSPLSPARP